MSDRPSIRRASLLPVLLVNFIGSLGFSLVMPFLVFLVLDFGGNPVIYGIVGATYSLFQFFGAPILGAWSDRFGRRKILLLSQAGTLFAWVMFVVALLVPRTELFSTEGSFLGAFTLSVPLVLLFLARAVDGLTGGNISVANAYVSDVSTPETRSANFGRMGVSFNLGMVVGPALAGLLGATVYGELVPVALAVGISVTALVLIYFYLPESKPQTERTDREHHRACARTLGSETRDPHTATHCPKKKRQSLLSHPTLRYMVVLLFAMFLGFNLFYACFPVHAAQSLGWDALTIGGFFTTLSASMVVVEGPVLSWLSSRSTEPTRIVAGLSILACGFAWMFWAEGVAIYGVAVLFAAGNGIAWPTLTAYLAGLVDDSVQGAVQGLSGSAGSLASIFGLISGGLLYAEIGAVAFLIASGLIAVSAALALRLWSLKPVELDELEDAAAFNELAAAEG